MQQFKTKSKSSGLSDMFPTKNLNFSDQPSMNQSLTRLSKATIPNKPGISSIEKPKLSVVPQTKNVNRKRKFNDLVEAGPAEANLQ